jgi:hypothetical protein
MWTTWAEVHWVPQRRPVSIINLACSLGQKWLKYNFGGHGQTYNLNHRSGWDCSKSASRRSARQHNQSSSRKGMLFSQEWSGHSHREVKKEDTSAHGVGTPWDIKCIGFQRCVSSDLGSGRKVHVDIAGRPEHNPLGPGVGGWRGWVLLSALLE